MSVSLQKLRRQIEEQIEEFIESLIDQVFDKLEDMNNEINDLIGEKEAAEADIESLNQQIEELKNSGTGNSHDD